MNLSIVNTKNYLMASYDCIYYLKIYPAPNPAPNLAPNSAPNPAPRHSQELHTPTPPINATHNHASYSAHIPAPTLPHRSQDLYIFTQPSPHYLTPPYAPALITPPHGSQKLQTLHRRCRLSFEA